MERSRIQADRRRWWWLAIVPLLPSLLVGFLLDDWIGLQVLLASEPGDLWRAMLPRSGDFLRPLGWVVFYGETLAFGLCGPCFHAVHLALFVSAARLTGSLGGRLAGDSRLVGPISVLALLYPGRIEAYTWLAAIFDLLALLLGLTLLWVWLRWRRFGGGWGLAGVCALALLATLAKESGFGLLPILLVWESIPGLLEPVPRARRLGGLAMAGAAFAAALGLRLWLLGSPGGGSGTVGIRALEGVGRIPAALFYGIFAPVNPRVGDTFGDVLAVLCGVLAALGLGLAAAAALSSSRARRIFVGGATLGILWLVPSLPYLRASAVWAHSRYLTYLGAGLAMALAASALERRPVLRRVGVSNLVALAAAWALATLLNLAPFLEAARSRDLILERIGLDTTDPGPHRVWVEGPINRWKGAHLLGGALEAALAVTYPEREIDADSAYFQRYRGQPVGPGRPRPEERLHVYRFDPSVPALTPTGIRGPDPPRGPGGGAERSESPGGAPAPPPAPGARPIPRP